MKHYKNLRIHEKHVFLHFGVSGDSVFGIRGYMENVYIKSFAGCVCVYIDR